MVATREPAAHEGSAPVNCAPPVSSDDKAVTAELGGYVDRVTGQLRPAHFRGKMRGKGGRLTPVFTGPRLGARFQGE